MYSVHGQGFIDTFLGFNNITRFTTPEHPTRVVWYYYIPVLILGLFPWTGLFLSSLKASYNESSGTDFDLMIFMNIWWIFVFIFFTISKTKLVSYIFPLFPPIAIIIGWNISRLLNERFRKTESFIACSSIFMFLLLACGWVYGGSFFPELTIEGRVLGGITVLFAIAIGMALLKYKDIKLAILCHVIAGIVTMFVVFSFILPPIANRLSVKQVATYYTENCDLTANVYIDKLLRPGFMYYTHIPGEELKAESGDTPTPTITAKSANNYIIVRGLEYRRWDDTMKSNVQEIYTTGDIYLLNQMKNTPQ
jgi:4-amino-4-deoxy-L-arabinose transferase-like glycosyltransferase